MPKKITMSPDLESLAEAFEALNRSSSRAVLVAHLEYLRQRFDDPADQSAKANLRAPA